MKVLLFLLTLALAQTNESNEVHSVTFYVIGDYGINPPYDNANLVFSALDQTVSQAATNSKPSFFISVGDNVNVDTPSEILLNFTYEEKHHFFDTPNLKNIPVYVTRGNLDAQYLSWSQMVEASMTHAYFNYPSLYYTKIVKIGTSTTRIGLMFVDAVLFLCSTDNSAHKEPEAYEALKNSTCNSKRQAWGD
jgi:hypothetical protein